MSIEARCRDLVAGLQSVKTGDMIETGKYKEYRNMERLKRISAATALLVLSLGITVTIPVYAEGSSNSGSDSSVSDQSSSGSTLEDRQKLAEDRQAVKTAATTVKEDRQQLKTDRTEKTAEQKQKLCTAHKQGRLPVIRSPIYRASNQVLTAIALRFRPMSLTSRLLPKTPVTN
jgi:hypothetical protein